MTSGAGYPSSTCRMAKPASHPHKQRETHIHFTPEAARNKLCDEMSQGRVGLNPDPRTHKVSTSLAAQFISSRIRRHPQQRGLVRNVRLDISGLLMLKRAVGLQTQGLERLD